MKIIYILLKILKRELRYRFIKQSMFQLNVPNIYLFESTERNWRDIFFFSPLSTFMDKKFLIS